MELPIIVSVFVAHAIYSLAARSRRLVDVSALVATGITLAVSIMAAYKVGTQGTYHPFSFITIDSLGALLMIIVAIVAFLAAAYALPYLRKELAKGVIGTRRVNQYYTMSSAFLACIYLTMSTTSPVATWIFLEATTLTTVFLVSFYNRKSTVEAAWKYMIINAVGLLLAFLGTLLYFTGAQHGISGVSSWETLALHAKQLDPALLKVAFIFVLIGYGTKIGLAPMHTWKPDTYSKVPSPLGALFSGALMPVAFMVLLRFKALTDAAIGPSFSRSLLIGFGLLSMVVGALSLVSTSKNKKLLAYSSIEHAGIMALGLGFGGIGTLAALLHMIYHSLVKSSLFFLTGNMLLKYHSTSVEDVKGAMSVMPVNSIMYFAAIFAISGSPPFGIFLTEIFILVSGIKHYPLVVVVALASMVIAFIGLSRRASSMIFGEPSEGIEKAKKASSWLLVPSIIVLTLTLIATFYIPEFIKTLIYEAAGKI